MSHGYLRLATFVCFRIYTLFENDLRVGSKLFVRVPLNVCQTGGITQQIYYYAEVDFVKWDFNCDGE